MTRALVLVVVLAGLSGCSEIGDANSDGTSGSSGSSGSSAHRYSSCARLNLRYPDGVGINGADDETHGTRRPTRDYTVSSRVYRANRRLDRDGDGIVCESPYRR